MSRTTSTPPETTSNLCPSCGNEFPPNAPMGMCPVCELRAALIDNEDLTGSIIDKYKIVECIGEGGFGEVYLAVRDHPKQKVAIKILRRNRLDEHTKERFMSEQQVMALMSHPNIAQIYDVGETSWRAPFLVMELVEGEPITDYCDRKRLAPSERLRLFMDVCSGLQHAHRNAIIHRDR